MNIFVCVDEYGGMLFNKRRLSRDAAVIEKILEISGGSKLYMNAYSAKLFDGHHEIIVNEDFLHKANPEDYCFVENIEIPEEGIDKLYIFNWNRRYPSDLKFNYDIIENGFEKIGTEEFEGSSHERITLDIYGRNVL